MPTGLGRILDRIAPPPVLVDIGASGACPEIWRQVASWSTYVGFDPDRRDLHTDANSPFKRYLVIPAAVSPESGTATLYETKFAHCSSLMAPDTPALSDYLFADSFTVERTRQLTTVTLAEALQSAGLGEKIDWLKSDTQGMDLRIIQSLPPALQDGLLAVDVEPGLINAYRGEDHFVTAHQYLMAAGFWPSVCKVCGDRRMRPETLADVASRHTGLTPQLVNRVLRPAPGWIEGRYLRRLDWLAEHKATVRDYLLLWCFAMVDLQYGFALDIAVALRKLGEAETGAELEQLAIAALTGSPVAWRPLHLLSRALRKGHLLLTGQSGR